MSWLNVNTLRSLLRFIVTHVCMKLQRFSISKLLSRFLRGRTNRHTDRLNTIPASLSIAGVQIITGTEQGRNRATTAEKLRGPRFGSQHRGACSPRPAKGRTVCWVRKGVAPSRCEGPGVSPPENF